MKVVSWNVNSLRARLERVIAWLDRHRPDVLCLQETKVSDDAFPAEAFERLGYSWTAFGQRGGYNGVATISRSPALDVERGFGGCPASDQARALSVTIEGIRIVNLYVVNGQSLESDKYTLKLAWLDALIEWLGRCYRPEEPVLLLGDFNIAPDERDVYDPEIWRDRVLCSAAERGRLAKLTQWGLTDLFRVHDERAGTFSWWDYRHGAFHRDWGLRIDLVLGTKPLVQRSTAVEIDRTERKPKAGPGKPSDHAPVVATFAADAEK